MSINLNELRLGNYVSDDENKVVKICRLESDNYVKFNGNNSGSLYVLEELTVTNSTPYVLSKTINPIPITEQWLLDFGFNQTRKNGHFLSFTHNISGHLIYLDNNIFFFSLVGKHKLQYIHELQNLFFAFYKEELTLNNK